MRKKSGSALYYTKYIIPVGALANGWGEVLQKINDAAKFSLCSYTEWASMRGEKKNEEGNSGIIGVGIVDR